MTDDQKLRRSIREFLQALEECQFVKNHAQVTAVRKRQELVYLLEAPREQDPAIATLVDSLERAITYAYLDHDEHGAFVRGGGGEYVPSPFGTIKTLRKLLGL